MKSGMEYTCYRLSVDEAKYLIERNDGQLLEDYSNASSKVYEFDSGEIVEIIRRQLVQLYESLEEYILILNDSYKSINHYHKERWFIEKNGVIHSYQQLLKEEALKLLAREHKYRTMVLTDKIGTRRDFLLENGQILLLSHDEYELSVLFESSKKYAIYEQSISGHMLKGLDRYRGEFRDHISEMIVELAHALEMELDVLDKSPESLKLI